MPRRDDERDTERPPAVEKLTDSDSIALRVRDNLRRQDEYWERKERKAIADAERSSKIDILTRNLEMMTQKVFELDKRDLLDARDLTSLAEKMASNREKAEEFEERTDDAIDKMDKKIEVLLEDRNKMNGMFRAAVAVLSIVTIVGQVIAWMLAHK